MVVGDIKVIRQLIFLQYDGFGFGNRAFIDLHHSSYSANANISQLKRSNLCFIQQLFMPLPKYIIMRHTHHNILHRPSALTHHIHQQLSALDIHNQQLITLAQTIQRNSIMLHTHPPTMIAAIEEQLRKGLTLIVESINQLYKDIDRRLRTAFQSLQQFNCSQGGLGGPYQSLVDRIASLEEILKNSQQNEAKLLQIIEKLQSKDEQQPKKEIGIKQLESKVYRGFGRFSFEKSRVKSNASQSSFRLFALNNHSENIEKQAVKIANKHIAKNSPFSCMGVLPTESVLASRSEQTRVELRGMGSQISQGSNHSHRLNFMMNTLGG